MDDEEGFDGHYHSAEAFEDTVDEHEQAEVRSAALAAVDAIVTRTLRAGQDV